MIKIGRRSLPYVVLFGKIGSGKSTIIEKIRPDKKNLSSNSTTSFTRMGTIYHAKKIKIADTPGYDGRDRTFDDNLIIALTLNKYKVSLILVVINISGCNRFEEACNEFENQSSIFNEKQMKFVVPVFTHMDRSSWKEEEFRIYFTNQTGQENMIFTNVNTTGKELEKKIASFCFGSYTRFNIDHKSFLETFPLRMGEAFLLRKGDAISRNFKRTVDSFKEKMSTFPQNTHLDLIFDFHIFMKKKITEIRSNFISENNIQLIENKGVAVVANLTNRLKETLKGIREMVYENQNAPEFKKNLRKCPYCSEIWTKVQGCDGLTTCGNRPDVPDVIDDLTSSRFSFDILNDGDINILQIDRLTIDAYTIDSKPKKRIGCGRNIKWKNMKPVKVPKVFFDDETHLNIVTNTNDIQIFDNDSQEDTFKKRFLENAKKNEVQEDYNSSAYGVFKW